MQMMNILHPHLLFVHHNYLVNSVIPLHYNIILLTFIFIFYVMERRNVAIGTTRRGNSIVMKLHATGAFMLNGLQEDVSVDELFERIKKVFIPVILECHQEYLKRMENIRIERLDF